MNYAALCNLLRQVIPQDVKLKHQLSIVIFPDPTTQRLVV
jgi:hypothetical protein